MTQMTEIFTGDKDGEVAITEAANGTYAQMESRVSALKKGWHLVVDKADGQSLFCARLSDDFDSMWMLWEVFAKLRGLQDIGDQIPFYLYKARHDAGTCMSMGEAVEGLLAFSYSANVWTDEWVTRAQEMDVTSYNFLRSAGSIF